MNVEQLLSDKRVIAEIERHLWIESEKAGYDIGFERAKEEWLQNFSRAWMSYHMPEAANRLRPAEKNGAESAARKARAKSSGIKKRRAKSYIK